MIGVFAKSTIKHINYKDRVIKSYCLAVRSLWANILK